MGNKNQSEYSFDEILELTKEERKELLKMWKEIHRCENDRMNGCENRTE